MVFKGFMDSINKEKRQKETVKTVQQIALGVGIAALAAAAGVATGMLIAPKSGKETRDEMKACISHCRNHAGCCPDGCKEGDDACGSSCTGNS